MPNLPIPSGKGRFGPFLKWSDLYVNLPTKYKLETITVDNAHKLIEAKINKEANRYVQQWEKEDIAIENGRWGPFIRFKKNNVSFPKKDGEKMTSEKAATLTLEEVRAIIEAALPGSFKK